MPKSYGRELYISGEGRKEREDSMKTKAKMTATLRDAIDQDIFRIDDDQFSDADFQAMSIDELETIKLRINKKISNLSAGIAKGKLEQANGETSSTERLMSRKAALSINERVSAYVKNLISKRIRMSKTTGDCFMRHAKATLPREVYERILNDANQETANITKEDRL
jgi:hypothetical protein